MNLESKTKPREALLKAALHFVRAASSCEGVARIALIGSLVTSKPNPKDVDLLVTVRDDCDLKELATLGRKIKGRMQGINRGADIFLCTEDHRLIGRTCSYREPWPRARCRPLACHERTWACDVGALIRFAREELAKPPLEIWPKIVRRAEIPDDVERILAAPLSSRLSSTGAQS